MLGTLLDKLTSLFSKAFAVGSVPMLTFLLLNGVMIYRVSYEFQKWVAAYVLVSDAAQLAVFSLAVFLLVLVCSYVFSTANVVLREILEGKHFGALVFDALSQRYRDDLGELESALDDARQNRREIRRNQKLWTEKLQHAYKQGRNQSGCNYDGSRTLDKLLSARAGNQSVFPGELKTEVDLMEVALRANNPELQDNLQSANLVRDHRALVDLIDYSVSKWEAESVRLLNKLQFDYAGGKNVAPTKIGNISNAASYYAASRYSITLEIFWSRLQKVLQGDPNFYGVLQDAKLQVDFLVSLVWLTLTFTLIWVVLLPCLGEEISLFALIAVVGPALTYLWYRIAIQNYRAFSDLLRASIDLYRLDLLKSLHVSLPANAEHERTLWENLESRIGYGEHTNIALQ